ncbi:MAG: VWA domain-containing protein [Verrucomicrobia bacterium]|nr:VWA domain-containing protein [Verrucomicrobiota bacterium]
MKTQFILSILCVGGLLAAPASAADPVEVRVDLAHPKIPAQKQYKTYLKVGLVGLQQKEKPARPPVNVTIVLDRSGSMSGPKMEHARQAAVEALQRLGGDDIVSVVTFDDGAESVVPATKMTNRDDIVAAIQKITPRGRTALFAGVSRAAEELRKFKTPQMVNRIVLLSDGMANIGPSSADEMGRYGVSLAKESISVTTLGLGLDYNEKLLAQLAQHSDGNHAFIKEPGELAAVFTEEFGDILSVVAQEMQVKITCPEGVRPVRVLGRDASIRGSTVEVAMNQLRAGQEKYVLLEVDVPAGTGSVPQLIGDVEVSYRRNDASAPKQVVAHSLATRVTDDRAVESSASTPILVEVAKQIGVEKQMIAVKLTDEGKTKEAEKVFLENAGTLQMLGQKYRSPDLYIQGNANVTLGLNTTSSSWQTYRNAGQTMANLTMTQNGSANNASNVNDLNGGQAVNVPALESMFNRPSQPSELSIKLGAPPSTIIMSMPQSSSGTIILKSSGGR